jgi:hypothetical protein
MNFVAFKYRFTEKEFIKAALYLRFKNAKIRIFCFFLLIVGLVNIALNYHLNQKLDLADFWILLLFPLFFLFLVFGDRKVFRSSERNSLEIYNSFDDENYKASGKDFKTEIKISTIFKVEKTKHWIYIFTLKGYAQFLKTKDVSDDNLKILKLIFDKNKVKNNL